MNHSPLLINESPLQVIPSLAVAIGLNESIVLQQVQFWLVRSKHEADGRQWVYNTLEAWAEQFPFWSEVTVRRTIKRLEDLGLLLSRCDLNEHPFDRTKWYSIDYLALEVLARTEDSNPHDASDQIDPMYPVNEIACIGSSGSDDYHESTQETTHQYPPPVPSDQGDPMTDDGGGEKLRLSRDPLLRAKQVLRLRDKEVFAIFRAPITGNDFEKLADYLADLYERFPSPPKLHLKSFWEAVQENLQAWANGGVRTRAMVERALSNVIAEWVERNPQKAGLEVEG